MDLEGITWIGNTYQKFEAMCLEVEEIMYKDTAKYVENQVQTVSDSMKRFYSDVMLDFLHPSVMDPGKGAYTDLPVEPYVDTGICLKPMVGKKVKDMKVVDVEKRTEDQAIVGKKLTEDQKVTSDNDKMSPPMFHDLHYGDHLCPPCQRGSASGARGRHIKQNLSDKSNHGLYNTFKREKLSSKQVSMVMAPSDPSFVRESSTCEHSKENQGACCRQNTSIKTSRPVEVSGEDVTEGTKIEIEKASECKPDILCYEPYSDTVTIAKSGWRETDMQISYCADIFEKSKGASNDGSKDLEVNVTCAEQDPEIIQQMDEETCVMVNEDEVHSVPHKEVKSRDSKKMWDVFSSRKSLMRKEYEKLAAQHGGDSKPDQQESAEDLMSATAAYNAIRSTTNNSCESEWELI